MELSSISTSRWVDEAMPSWVLWGGGSPSPPPSPLSAAAPIPSPPSPMYTRAYATSVPTHTHSRTRVTTDPPSRFPRREQTEPTCFYAPRREATFCIPTPSPVPAPGRHSGGALATFRPAGGSERRGRGPLREQHGGTAALGMFSWSGFRAWADSRRGEARREPSLSLSLSLATDSAGGAWCHQDRRLRPRPRACQSVSVLTQAVSIASMYVCGLGLVLSICYTCCRSTSPRLIPPPPPPHAASTGFVSALEQRIAVRG
ncbi:hypothetical protein GGS23DRAFT_365157 [Durotheca rogersii]|uniref:uncharacterized protein n=1 Tax=Durotheca rogersii TaxID=419775 RepID=UPI0022209238|nr:uncharacterized protein GGS23DRAFT_365157 [Durotheca rogersii]KAI5866025.1 hypothetical protein GGS23DRAFT_365157 [Durotheca rogersii]